MCTEKNIEGIWHTAIVVFGKEHFFGSNGISICKPVSLIPNSRNLQTYMNKIIEKYFSYKFFSCLNVLV